MKSRIIIGSLLALSILIAIASATGLLKSPSSQQQTPTATVTPYVVHRTQELPLITQRKQVMADVQQATSATPWGIALDKMHGYVWVAEPGCEPTPKCPAGSQGKLGQFSYADGNFITDYDVPTGFSTPLFLVADHDDKIWFTQPTTDALGEYDVQKGTWNNWPLKKGSAPFDLALDAQGNLWITEFGTGAIAFFNTQTHALVETAAPTADSNPYGITIDSQGMVWFTENKLGVNQLGSFQSNTSGAIKITEHALNGLRPHLIATDHNGNVWYTQGFAGYIGEFIPKTGENKNFLVAPGICTNPQACTGTHISGVSIDSKNNVWFSDSLSHRIGNLNPGSGQVVTRTLPNINAHPHDGIIVDSNDRVWFTSQFALTLTMWPTSSVTG